VQPIAPHPNEFFQERQERLEPAFVQTALDDVLARAAAAGDDAEWLAVVRYWNEVRCHVMTHMQRSELAFRQSSGDAAGAREHRRLQEKIRPVFEAQNALVRERILASPSLGALERALGPRWLEVLKLRQRTFSAENIPLRTALEGVLNRHTALTAGARITVAGTSWPSSFWRKFADDPDPAVRREALSSYAGWYAANGAALDGLFDEALDLRRRRARNLGLASFVPLAYMDLDRTDWGPEDAARFRAAIRRTVVPICREIREAQARALGTPAGVHPADVEYFADARVAALAVGVDGQLGAAGKVFEALSPRLAGHFRAMVGSELIDLAARDGKAPGAFCTTFSDLRVPFVFCNSVDQASDVRTLLHECGHSFQVWESAHIEMEELRFPTLEACEVHSMSMEHLAYPHLGHFFSEEDSLRYRVSHLRDGLLKMAYMAAVDEFQHRIYEEKDASAPMRAAWWEELEDTYLPGMDYRGNEPWRRSRWHPQRHIFHWPFYYLDYALALTGAWQLWLRSRTESEAAIADYLDLCRAGGTLRIGDFFAAGRLGAPWREGVLERTVAEVWDALRGLEKRLST
jgi:M3 family oligoendopeptidase